MQQWGVWQIMNKGLRQIESSSPLSMSDTKETRSRSHLQNLSVTKEGHSANGMLESRHSWNSSAGSISGNGLGGLF